MDINEFNLFNNRKCQLDLKFSYVLIIRDKIDYNDIERLKKKGKFGLEKCK